MSKIFPQPLRTKIQPRRILPINRRTSAVLVARVSAADKARCELLWMVVMIFPGHVKTLWLVKALSGETTRLSSKTYDGRCLFHLLLRVKADIAFDGTNVCFDPKGTSAD